MGKLPGSLLWMKDTKDGTLPPALRSEYCLKKYFLKVPMEGSENGYKNAA